VLVGEIEVIDGAGGQEQDTVAASAITSTQKRGDFAALESRFILPPFGSACDDRITQDEIVCQVGVLRVNECHRLIATAIEYHRRFRRFRSSIRARGSEVLRWEVWPRM
jgi:hypothetical protein